jgi:hypothetical protein
MAKRGKKTKIVSAVKAGHLRKRSGKKGSKKRSYKR